MAVPRRHSAADRGSGFCAWSYGRLDEPRGPRRWQRQRSVTVVSLRSGGCGRLWAKCWSSRHERNTRENEIARFPRMSRHHCIRAPDCFMRVGVIHIYNHRRRWNNHGLAGIWPQRRLSQHEPLTELGGSQTSFTPAAAAWSGGAVLEEAGFSPVASEASDSRWAAARPNRRGLLNSRYRSAETERSGARAPHRLAVTRANR